MNSETKICQNCHQSFTIESEDFAFYEKIKVPSPTWCPECRLLRRILWRNDIFLYKRPDSRTAETIFSMYSNESPFKVWDLDYWLSDKWDPMEYGRDYDWNRPFFEQIEKLSREVPWANRSVDNAINSDYSNNATNIKNCYLVFGSGDIEDSYYSFALVSSKNVFDSAHISHSEISYESFYNRRCYRAFFSSHCEDSSDIIFCKDCSGVSNCFGCVGLRNKSYVIYNKQVSKEEYEIFVRNINLGSYENLKRAKEESRDFWLRFPVRFMYGKNITDASGDYIYNSRYVTDSFNIENGENLKYCHLLTWGNAKDSYDYFRFSFNAELIYESAMCGSNVSRLSFCCECYPNCNDMYYSLRCFSSHHLFGCVGLRNKEYCILNRQYTKEEYEALIPRIIEHMNAMPYVDQKGRTYPYGEFFPPELAPFAYNETIAQEYFPLTKEEAETRGYRWRDREERNYKIQIPNDGLPDHIHEVADDILNQTIGCRHQGACLHQCTTAFRIIPEELAFYRRMNLPLPRLCPNCRHYERLAQRNPLKLWHRVCQCAGQKSENGMYTNTGNHFHGVGKCTNEFETSYAPDRPEVVYCESCYQSEVA